MKLIDLTLAEPEGNIALDEAVLNEAEATFEALPGNASKADGVHSGGYLRLWNPERYVVVLGRSCRVHDEVYLDFCRENSIPIIRRSSGGGTILTGPGCLMYAVVVPYENHNELRMIDRAHTWTLDHMMTALREIKVNAASKGQSDLAIDQLKFSGNAMRCKRHHFLYHGTLLYDFDLPMIERVLRTPPRQPDYRAGRSHREFVTNLPATEQELRESIIKHWRAEPTEDWPESETKKLVAEKYCRDDWNFRM